MLPAEIVRQVRRIQLATGRQVADVLAGAYVSVFKGRGVEFDEVRPYVPGDDVRTIDWNVTARVGSPYVKRYVEERQLTVMLLVDMSASLDFGSAHRSKREAAVELSALLAFSAIHNDDKVGPAALPPRRRRVHPAAQGSEARPARGARSAGAGPGRRPPSSAPRAANAQTLVGTAALRVARSQRFAQLVGNAAAAVRARSTDIAARAGVLPPRAAAPRHPVPRSPISSTDDYLEHALANANRKHDVVAVRVHGSRARSAIEPAPGW